MPSNQRVSIIARRPDGSLMLTYIGGKLIIRTDDTTPSSQEFIPPSQHFWTGVDHSVEGVSIIRSTDFDTAVRSRYDPNLVMKNSFQPTTWRFLQREDVPSCGVQW